MKGSESVVGSAGRQARKLRIMVIILARPTAFHHHLIIVSRVSHILGGITTAVIISGPTLSDADLF